MSFGRTGRERRPALLVTGDPFASRLDRADESGTRRRLLVSDPAGPGCVVRDGVELIDFGSNDYLGLSRHPALIEAAREALDRYGTGSGSARLVTGTRPPHAELEEKLAPFLGKEAALSWGSGYAGNVGIMTALLGRGDRVYADRLAHASLLDGVRWSGAKLYRYAHNDPADLNRLLERHAAPKGTDLVVTESVFSMDGDEPPLAAIADAADRHGAMLAVDDAHGFGVLGPGGRGGVHDAGIADRVDLHIVTFGKAAGSAGGAVAASRRLIDGFVNFSRSFIFSTSPPPAQAAVSAAALDLLGGPEGERLREALARNGTNVRSGLADICHNLRDGRTPILPVFPGVTGAARGVAFSLVSQGVYAPAIYPPTVPAGTDRLRVSLSAAHSPEQVDRLVQGLRLALARPGGVGGS